MRARRFLTALAFLMMLHRCSAVQLRQVDAEFRTLINRLQYLHTNAMRKPSMYDSVASRLKVVLEDTGIVANLRENQLFAANYVRTAMATNCSAEILSPRISRQVHTAMPIVCIARS